MTLIVALLVSFCWLGLSERAFDRGTKWRLVGLIVAAVAIDFLRNVF